MASVKLNNPFVTSGYVSPDYFCDREQETNHLLEAINSSRNIALISIRRMGKTGLLKHIKFLINEQFKNQEVIYIDLMPTQSAGDFLSFLGNALIQVQHSEKNILEKVLSSLSHLRPGFSYDNLSGQPSLVFSIMNENEFGVGLNQLLALFSSIEKTLTIVLDEFQQILEYPEKNTEHLLRGIMQENPQITFILSGSNRHIMEAMLNTSSRPFYQSIELMYLDTISSTSYCTFIKNHFNQSETGFPMALIQKVLEWCRFHTFYVQHFCNRLFAKWLKVIDEAAINQLSIEILSSYEPLYLSYRKLLASHQYLLLQAIAAENGVSQPHSGDFIRKYKLKTASSVKSSLDVLFAKEMILNVNNQWIVYDVFFSRWLEHNWKMLNI